MASHSWALIGPWGKQYSRNPARSTRAGLRPIGTLSLAGGRGGGPPGDHLTLTPQLACGNSVALDSANHRRDSPRERGPNLQACRSKLIQISAAGRHTTVSCFNIPQRAIKSTAARGSIAGTIYPNYFSISWNDSLTSCHGITLVENAAFHTHLPRASTADKLCPERRTIRKSRTRVSWQCYAKSHGRLLTSNIW